MSTILSTKYKVTFIGETHQQYVSFQSAQIGSPAKREISDLWIIAFSPTKNRVRMTFLQAKYYRGLLGQHHRIFNADYFQYELLATRPQLIAVHGQRFNFPSDILSISCCDSVGSYGVFFIDNNRQVDLAYSCANSLTPQSPLPAYYSSFKVDLEIPFNSTNFYQNCSCSICPQELISCFDIDSFTNALVNLEIGAEIHFFPHILYFVKRVLSPYINQAAVKDLTNLIDTIPPIPTNDVNEDFEGIPTNILVINTDIEE